MKERVNLTIRPEHLERARLYADKVGKSLSEVTDELYAALEQPKASRAFLDFVEEDRKKYPKKPTTGRDYKTEYREAIAKKYGR